MPTDLNNEGFFRQLAAERGIQADPPLEDLAAAYGLNSGLHGHLANGPEATQQRIRITNDMRRYVEPPEVVAIEEKKPKEDTFTPIEPETRRIDL